MWHCLPITKTFLVGPQHAGLLIGVRDDPKKTVRLIVPYWMYENKKRRTDVFNGCSLVIVVFTLNGWIFFFYYKIFTALMFMEANWIVRYDWTRCYIYRYGKMQHVKQRERERSHFIAQFAEAFEAEAVHFRERESLSSYTVTQLRIRNLHTYTTHTLCWCLAGTIYLFSLNSQVDQNETFAVWRVDIEVNQNNWNELKWRLIVWWHRI